MVWEDWTVFMLLKWIPFNILLRLNVQFIRFAFKQTTWNFYSKNAHHITIRVNREISIEYFCLAKNYIPQNFISLDKSALTKRIYWIFSTCHTVWVYNYFYEQGMKWNEIFELKIVHFWHGNVLHIYQNKFYFHNRWYRTVYYVTNIQKNKRFF